MSPRRCCNNCFPPRECWRRSRASWLRAAMAAPKSTRPIATAWRFSAAPAIPRKPCSTRSPGCAGFPAAAAADFFPPIQGSTTASQRSSACASAQGAEVFDHLPGKLKLSRLLLVQSRNPVGHRLFRRVNKSRPPASKGARRPKAMDFNPISLRRNSSWIAAMAVTATLLAGCAGGALTTREKGAGIGALGGATAGGIIGSAVHHPLAGAMIGTVLGAGAGGLIGDQLQGRENVARDQDSQIQSNQQELERQRRDIEELRRRPEY